jgi:site-specific DNA recombinase
MTRPTSIEGQGMVRAGKWLRVSSGGQDEANQEPDVDRHCDTRSYHVAKTYTLHDKSASKGEQQEALDEVLDDLRRGEIQVLVCWNSDRLDRRGVKEALDFIIKVKKAGGRIESTTEGVLDEDSIDTIINAWMNWKKSAHLAEQVRAGHDRVRANGALHGRPPWGMTKTGPKYHKQLTPTDLGRIWVPQIFGWVIERVSFRDIILRLQAESIEGDHGVWHPSTIGEMIRNPVYMGFRCAQDPQTKKYGKILHKCEALVSPEVWRQAQEALDKSPTKRGYTNPETRPMLSGVLKCGNPECDATGAPDSPMNRSRSDTRTYYRCTGIGAIRKSCGTMVRLADVDSAVDWIIHETFNIPKEERRVIPGTDHTADLESLKFELRQLPARELAWDEEDSERARLRAEYDRIASLPVVPDEVVMVDSGQTYADLWDSMKPTDRGQWLRRQGFTVRASRTHVSVSHGDISRTVPLG